MHSTFKEKCGVFGAFNFDKTAVVETIYHGLLALQHRGQESSGIALFNGENKIRKSMGLAPCLVPSLVEISGNVGIGHVRYGTAGGSTLAEAQPFICNGHVFCHNGNILNSAEIEKNYTFDAKPKTDSDMLLKVLSAELAKGSDIRDAITTVSQLADGSYSAIFLSKEGEMVAFRDPLGFKPLSMGQTLNTTMVASETPALDINGSETFSDIPPGEMVIINEKTVERRRYAPKNSAFCFFEYTYFARPDAVLNGKLVYEVRRDLGRKLAETVDVNGIDYVIPVPDTARAAAEGFSLATSVPMIEGLVKDKYIGRTFIMPRKERSEMIRVKFNILSSMLENKSVLLVDDSIVRGTTSKAIINLVKRKASKVHLASTTPPIISPCFYGIDMATHTELIAADRNVEQIQNLLGVDSLNYQTIDGLVEAIGMPKSDLCLACLTGNYPTPCAQKLAEACRSMHLEGRYYENKSK